MPSERAIRAAQQRLSLLAGQPDEWAFPGVPDDGTWPGTPSEGYLYDIPHRPGYVYARVQAGSSYEVCEVVLGSVARNPNRLVGLRRVGAALVAQEQNVQAAVGGDGADAGKIPASSVTYDPTAPLTATNAQGALDEVAELLTNGTVFDLLMMSADGVPMVDADGYYMLRSD